MARTTERIELDRLAGALCDSRMLWRCDDGSDAVEYSLHHIDPNRLREMADWAWRIERLEAALVEAEARGNWYFYMVHNGGVEGADWYSATDEAKQPHYEAAREQQSQLLQTAVKTPEVK